MNKKKRLQYYLAGAVALLTFLVYLPSLQNDFVDWDDNMYVFENARIRSLDAAFFKWAFTNFDAANWHPLAWLSHALDYAVWGLNPAGHHLTSIVLHSVNAFIVVLLIIRLLEAVKHPALSDGQALISAATTGLLFGLHPVHVESVAWVAERKDLLCALFFMLSIMSYVKYASSRDGEVLQSTALSTFSDKHYGVSLLLFILASMSKPMAVSLPAVLFILDWHPFNRIRSLKSFQIVVIEKLPFIAVSLIASMVTLAAQKRAVVSVQSVLISERLLVAANALIAYLWKMILPVALIPYYQYPYPQEISALSYEYAFPVILTIGITVLVAVMARSHKSPAALWGYYLVTLFPVLGIVQVGAQAMADRYTYLPGLAPFFILGLIAARISEKLKSVTRKRTAVKFLSLALIISALVTLSHLTVRQIHIWKDSSSLWSYVKEYNPNVHLAYINLGLAHLRQGRIDDAVSEFNTAIRLNTVDADAHNYLGVVYYKQGRLDEAISKYQTACTLHPGYTQAHFNLGLAYFKQGRVDEAVSEYKTALSLDPDYAKAHYNLGIAYSHQGRVDEAVDEYKAALSLNPDFEEARERLAERK